MCNRVTQPARYTAYNPWKEYFKSLSGPLIKRKDPKKSSKCKKDYNKFLRVDKCPDGCDVGIWKEVEENMYALNHDHGKMQVWRVPELCDECKKIN